MVVKSGKCVQKIESIVFISGPEIGTLANGITTGY